MRRSGFGGYLLHVCAVVAVVFVFRKLLHVVWGVL